MTNPLSAEKTLGRALLFGAGGWAVENALFGPRNSALWGKARMPILPVYAIGGTLVSELAPRLQERAWPWYARATAYGAVLSGIEYAGCLTDRRVLGACSWDYTGQRCKKPTQGCVNFEHALLWGMLGLLVEKL